MASSNFIKTQWVHPKLTVVRYFMSFIMIISLLHTLPLVMITPKWRRIPSTDPHTNPNFYGEQFVYHTEANVSLSSVGSVANSNSSFSNTTGEGILAGNSNAKTILLNATVASPMKVPALLPFKDRYKFIHKREKLSLEGPIYNTIPETVTFKEELSQAKICDSKEPFILAVVHTAVKNRWKRDEIRKTWANKDLYPRTGIRTVFIVGATTDKSLQDMVDLENRHYNDILQYNFIDSYGNLTYKTMAWLKWVNKHCPEVPFVAKIDDDVIVNPFNLKKYLENQLSKTEETGRTLDETKYNALRRRELAHPATNFIYGRLETAPRPHRSGKWGVPKEAYPELNFPPFVLGPAYIVGGNVLGRLFKYAPYTPLLWLEDVYTTGLVAHAAQVKHVQASSIYIAGGANDSDLYRGVKAFWVEHGRDRSTTWQNIMKYS